MTNKENPILVWHSSAPDNEVENYLSNFKCPISLEVQIEFRSYSGKQYKYTYEVIVDRDEKGRYYVDKTRLKESKLPWD